MAGEKTAEEFFGDAPPDSPGTAEDFFGDTPSQEPVLKTPEFQKAAEGVVDLSRSEPAGQPGTADEFFGDADPRDDDPLVKMLTKKFGRELTPLEKRRWSFQPEDADITQRPAVQSILNTLDIPLNVAAGAVARGLSIVDPEAAKELNPDDLVAPKLYYSDISNYLVDKNKPKAIKSLMDAGFSLETAGTIVASGAVPILGAGHVADFIADPLVWLSFGAKTKRTTDLLKKGATSLKREPRAVVQVTTPFRGDVISVKGIPLEITSSHVKNIPIPTGIEKTRKLGALVKVASKRGEAAIRALPGGAKGLALAGRTKRSALDYINSFNVWTGDLEVDIALSNNSARKRGDVRNIGLWTDMMHQAKWNEKELQMMFEVAEGTPNLSLPVKKKFLKGARARFVEEGQLRPLVARRAARVNQVAKGGLTEDRLSQMTDHIMEIKRMNANNVLDRLRFGLLPQEDLKTFVYPRYVAHRISPEAQKYMRQRPELAMAIGEAEQEAALAAGARGSKLQSFDPASKRRRIGGKVQRANQILKEKTKGAVPKWFIEDPILATAENRFITRRVIRDKQAIETIKSRAIRPADAAEERLLNNSGWGKLDNPEFEGVTIFVTGKNGKRSRVKVHDLYLPPNIHPKLSYFLDPAGVQTFGRFTSWADSYNRTFRSFALYKPDYHIQNWGENTFKAWAAGATLEDFVDAARLDWWRYREGHLPGTTRIMGKSKIPAPQLSIPQRALRATLGEAGDAPKIVRRGETVDGRTLLEAMEELNVEAGQYREGWRGVMHFGKKYRQDASRKGMKIVGKGGEFVKESLGLLTAAGDKGENFTRKALFISFMKRGYSPERAAMEVERYLFDFSRNTRNTDIARHLGNPFLQAAVKTAFIAPELVGKSPGKVAFLHNRLPGKLADLSKTIFELAGEETHDPVTDEALAQFLPPYEQFRSPVFGPIMPGNSWLARTFANPNQVQQLGVVPVFSTPVGLDILDQFDLRNLDPSRGGRTVVSGPFVDFASMIIKGVDPLTGQSVDIPGDPDNFSRRANAAIAHSIATAFTMPQTYKYIKQKLEIGDVEYMTPTTTMLLHGSLGKFARVHPLDQDYHFRMQSFLLAEKELVKQLGAAIFREAKGKTGAFVFESDPKAQKMFAFMLRAKSSDEIYRAFTTNMERAGVLSNYRNVLNGQMTANQAAAAINDLHKKVKELNDTYVATKKFWIASAAESKLTQEEFLKKFTEERTGDFKTDYPAEDDVEFDDLDPTE